MVSPSPPALGFFSRLQQAYAGLQKHDGDLMAAAVAYYAALALFPLLLVLISGLGYFMQFTRWGQDAEQQVLAAITEYASPSVMHDVQEMLHSIQRNAAVGGPLGMVTLLITAIALFAQIDRAFHRIWQVQSDESQGILAAVKSLLFERLKAFLMLLGLGALVIVIFLSGMILAGVKTYVQNIVPLGDWAWWVVQISVSVGLNSAVIASIYKILPPARVSWYEALQGGLLTAVVWEIGRVILAAFLIGSNYTAYGIIGSFIGVMLWCYYASLVLFLGAEYVQTVCHDCTPEERAAQTQSAATPR